MVGLYDIPLCDGIPNARTTLKCLICNVICRYYWNPNAHYSEILSDYISYEYGSDEVEDVLALMELIEENHVLVEAGKAPDLDAAKRAEALATAIDGRISERAKTAWRWRILYIRARLDLMRYSYYFENGLSGVDGRRILMRRSGFCLEHNEEAQAYFKELCAYFCCVDYNGQNRWTHPPVNGGAPEDFMEETTKYGTNFNTENRYSDGDTAEGN